MTPVSGRGVVAGFTVTHQRWLPDFPPPYVIAVVALDSWLESLGFCEPGGARDFIDEGRGIALGGRLPVNLHGGQLSAGRLHGFGHVREAMLRLRGEAAGRQVPDAPPRW